MSNPFHITAAPLDASPRAPPRNCRTHPASSRISNLGPFLELNPLPNLIVDIHSPRANGQLRQSCQLLSNKSSCDKQSSFLKLSEAGFNVLIHSMLQNRFHCRFSQARWPSTTHHRGKTPHITYAAFPLDFELSRDMLRALGPISGNLQFR